MAFVVAACGGEEATTTTAGPATTGGGTATTAAPAGEVKTLKIGTVMPLTGPLSVVSLAFTRGWEIYADEVNAAGGVKIGNDTYKLEFINEDSKGSAEGASTAATKLVNQDKVQLIIGGILESEMAAVYQVTGPAGVLYARPNANIPGPQTCPPTRTSRSGRSSTMTTPSPSTWTTSPRPTRTPRRSPCRCPTSATTPWSRSEDRGHGEGHADRAREMDVGHHRLHAGDDQAPGVEPDVIWAMVSGQANDQLKAARQMGFKGVFVSNSPLGADVFVATVQDPVMLTDVICNSPDVTHPTRA